MSSQQKRADDSGGAEWQCPYGCGDGPFDCMVDWIEHQRNDHDVNGPL